MPNWITNTVIARNPEEFLKDTNGETAMDFNKVIPMPEDLNISSGSTSWRKYCYFSAEKDSAFKFQEDVLEPLLSSIYTEKITQEEFVTAALTNLKSLGRKEEAIKLNHYSDEDDLKNMIKGYFNIQRYSATDWYDWRLTNWSTKWNTFEEDTHIKEGILYFQTAWNPPYNIYTKLAEKHDFVVLYADEDIGANYGVLIAKDGKLYNENLEIEESEYETAFATLIWNDGDMSDLEESEEYKQNQKEYDDIKILYDRFRNYAEWDEPIEIDED